MILGRLPKITNANFRCFLCFLYYFFSVRKFSVRKKQRVLKTTRFKTRFKKQRKFLLSTGSNAPVERFRSALSTPVILGRLPKNTNANFRDFFIVVFIFFSFIFIFIFLVFANLVFAKKTNAFSKKKKKTLKKRVPDYLKPSTTYYPRLPKIAGVSYDRSGETIDSVGP